MGIFLLILKILGIVLLCILGLILLIILLVLFTPISYRIKAQHGEEKTEANAKIGFLIAGFKASFVKGTGLDYKVTVCGIKIMGKDDKPKKKKKKKKDAGSDEFDQFEDTVPTVDSDGNVVPELTSDSTESDDNLQLDDLDEPIETEGDSRKDKKKKNKKDKKSKKKDKKSKDKKDSKSKGPKEKKTFAERIDNLFEKINNILDNLDEKYEKALTKYDELMTKKEHIEQFLEKDFVQRTIKRVFKVIKRLLLTIKPKKSKGYLHMGLASPAQTGEILGKISMFYGLYGSWLTIDPDFYNKVIEGNIDIRGRIYLFRFVFPAIRIILSRDFWRTKKLAEKI